MLRPLHTQAPCCSAVLCLFSTCLFAPQRLLPGPLEAHSPSLAQISTSLSFWLGTNKAKDEISLATQELCSSQARTFAESHKVERLDLPECLPLLPRCLQTPNNKEMWSTSLVAGVPGHEFPSHSPVCGEMRLHSGSLVLSWNPIWSDPCLV